MKRKAFTLIELLIVIAIVTILAAMIGGAISKIRHKKVNNTTQTAPSSDPTKSPLIPGQQPATSPYVASTFMLQINDPVVAKQVVDLLKTNGYKVEPFADKASLVFKP